MSWQFLLNFQSPFFLPFLDEQKFAQNETCARVLPPNKGPWGRHSENSLPHAWGALRILGDALWSEHQQPFNLWWMILRPFFWLVFFVIYSPDFESHIQDWTLVFSWYFAGLSLNFHQSRFAQGRLEYLGHWVSNLKKGLKPIQKRCGR